MVNLKRFWRDHTQRGLKGYAGLIGYAIIIITHVQMLNSTLPEAFQQLHAVANLVALSLIFYEHY